VSLASARSGQRERVFMITGIGVHDRTDWPFTITGMRTLWNLLDRGDLAGCPAMATTLAKQLVLDALNMTLATRRPRPAPEWVLPSLSAARRRGFALSSLPPSRLSTMRSAMIARPVQPTSFSWHP
jgi:hypothetical protein